MTITTASLKVPTKPKMKEQMHALIQDKGRRKPTLQEMQDKQYPFPDSDISKMSNHLLQLQLIELSEMKRLEEASQTNDPKYCKYHRLISHRIERCFMLKDKIMELAYQGKITFDDEVVTSNLAMITSKTYCTFPTIQFGSFETIEMKELSSSMATKELMMILIEIYIFMKMNLQLLIKKNCRKKSSVLVKEIPKKSYVVRKPTRVEKSRRTKVTPLPLEEKFVQNS